MCRKRGRIVLVGVTGLELSRADFYEKELTFQVSCSYGPGRYDPAYEEQGQDYPVGFVRWTEQRNFEAVLDMMADGRLDVAPLISHRFAIDDADAGLRARRRRRAVARHRARVSARGADATPRRRRAASHLRAAPPPAPAARGVARLHRRRQLRDARVLIPAFKATGARLRTVASARRRQRRPRRRASSASQATTTDSDALLADRGDRRVVVIATRHDSHAALRAAGAARRQARLRREAALPDAATSWPRSSDAFRARRSPLLMVGFNRRFAPHVAADESAARRRAAGRRRSSMTVNAGAIPREHWTQDPAVGGGRIVGEACHFIDLLRYLAGAPIARPQRARARRRATPATRRRSASRFADGSIGTIHYLANGSKAFPKERLEVFAGGRVLQLDNFRRLTGFGWPGFARMRLWRQDKGQRACAQAFVARGRSRAAPAPIPFAELLEVGRVTIEIAEELRCSADAGARADRHRRRRAAELHEGRADHPRAARARPRADARAGASSTPASTTTQRMSGDFFDAARHPRARRQPRGRLGHATPSRRRRSWSRYEQLLARRAQPTLVPRRRRRHLDDGLRDRGAEAGRRRSPTSRPGIRSGDWTMPEEINRMVTDAITDCFFTTSEVGRRRTCAARASATSGSSSSATR